MGQEAESSFRVTADDLRRYDWQEKLSAHPTKECTSYYELFVGAAKACEVAGDDLGHRVFSLLCFLASFQANYDAKGNPYGPMWRSGERRALMPDDLTDDDMATIRAVLEEIVDPEFRARVGDIIWECRRDHTAARVAIRAYIESARRLESAKTWPAFVERLERAVQLAAKLGFGQALHHEMIAEVEGAIRRYEDHPDSERLCGHLMGLLLVHNSGEAGRYAVLSERLAEHFQKNQKWDFAEEYWQIARRWYGKMGDEAAAQRCEVAAAETSVSAAETNLLGKSPSHSFAAHWMGRGVEGLRRAKADPARIQEVHKRFLELQRLALGEMGAIPFSPDGIPDFRDNERKIIEAVRMHVGGCSFEEALERLATIRSPTDVKALRERVGRNAKKFPFLGVVTEVAVDHGGKVADVAPAMLFAGSDERETAIWKQMLQEAKIIEWPLSLAWYIRPARSTIVAEHGVRLRDLRFLVERNPFVPVGHEFAVLRGIQAGFFGDWMTSLSLLIPKLECCIRAVLQQHGVITSTLESDGTQEERDLGWLLTHPKTEEVFGPEITFDLRGILIERFGHNLRNYFAHGLLPDGGFFDEISEYVWWLMIHLCWSGHICVPKNLKGSDSLESEK